MILTTRVGLLAGASALALTGASLADTTESARIAELEAKVAQLTGENWLTEQRADEIRGLVQDVLADADTRASLLNTALEGGYDRGFVIGSGDGMFSLRMNGQIQTRFVFNNQDMSPTGDDNLAGFENTRTRLMFSGNVGGPEWGYYVNGDFGGFNNGGGGFNLRDAWLSYDMGDGTTIKMGQFKVPINREFTVDSMHQLAVERSLMSYLFNGGRTQGIVLEHAADQWRFMGSYNDGAYGDNTAWNATTGSLAGNLSTEYSFTARGDWLLSGNWGQFHDFTSPMGSEQGVMLGGGVHYQKDESGTAAANEVTLTALAADASFEFDGANVFLGFGYADYDTGVAATDFTPMGFVAQGGMYFADDMEAFVRYEWADIDLVGVEDLSILTFGLNVYYSPHVKMTTDIGLGLDSVGAVPIASQGNTAPTGWRNDLGAPTNEDGQFVWRTQLQITF